MNSGCLHLESIAHPSVHQWFVFGLFCCFPLKVKGKQVELLIVFKELRDQDFLGMIDYMPVVGELRDAATGLRNINSIVEALAHTLLFIRMICCFIRSKDAI